jgi:hypothetical protein
VAARLRPCRLFFDDNRCGKNYLQREKLQSRLIFAVLGLSADMPKKQHVSCPWLVTRKSRTLSPQPLAGLTAALLSLAVACSSGAGGDNPPADGSGG